MVFFKIGRHSKKLAAFTPERRNQIWLNNLLHQLNVSLRGFGAKLGGTPYRVT